MHWCMWQWGNYISPLHISLVRVSWFVVTQNAMMRDSFFLCLEREAWSVSLLLTLFMRGISNYALMHVTVGKLHKPTTHIIFFLTFLLCVRDLWSHQNKPFSFSTLAPVLKCNDVDSFFLCLEREAWSVSLLLTLFMRGISQFVSLHVTVGKLHKPTTQNHG